MTAHPFRVTTALLSSVLCLTLGACKSTKKNGDEIVDYTSPDTGLAPSEYPFDESGNYREDWASGGAVADAGIYSDPVADTPPPSRPSSSSSSRSSSSSSSSSRKSSSSSSKPKTTAKSKPKPKPVAKPTVVTVKQGDTLTAISRRTGVSVASLKSYNGMKSDFLRAGQSLKVPPKKK